MALEGSAKVAPERVDRRCGRQSCAVRSAYVVEAWCTNCSWRGELIVTVGHEVTHARLGAECPRCECRRLHSGDFIERIDKDRGGDA